MSTQHRHAACYWYRQKEGIFAESIEEAEQSCAEQTEAGEARSRWVGKFDLILSPVSHPCIVRLGIGWYVRGDFVARFRETAAMR